MSRAIASHRYRIGTVEEERLVFPHAQWMMQRPLDHYRSLNAAEREGTDRLLRACGGYEAMQFRPPVRLERRDNRLVIASSTQENS